MKGKGWKEWDGDHVNNLPLHMGKVGGEILHMGKVGGNILHMGKVGGETLHMIRRKEVRKGLVGWRKEGRKEVDSGVERGRKERVGGLERVGRVGRSGCKEQLKSPDPMTVVCKKTEDHISHTRTNI